MFSGLEGFYCVCTLLPKNNFWGLTQKNFFSEFYYDYTSLLSIYINSLNLPNHYLYSTSLNAIGPLITMNVLFNSN